MTGGQLTSSLLFQSWPRVWLEETDSTNAEAGRRIASGEVGPLWIAARRQSAGRGRRGKSWVSEPGNLFATALFPFDDSPAKAVLICFTTCLALRKSFEDMGCDVEGVQYKWPNDLMAGGRKLSGILIETVQISPGVLGMSVGIGVNLVTAPDAGQPTARLTDLCANHALSPEALLERLAERFREELSTLLSLGFDPVRQEWLNHARGLNKLVEVSVGEEKVCGVFKDLEMDGAMLVQDQSGKTRRITAGDVQLLSE